MDVAREVISHKYPKVNVYDDKQLDWFGRKYVDELDGGENYQRISADSKRIMRDHGIHGEVCCYYYIGFLRAR
ncbi:MAG: hypothetical protein NTY03_00615 [Candidatus Bathyarchaeota archaeon]|jgi:hypothetical protein|nr:hypothetical protein [Candidatus Bathyarchaeota archaeon]